MLATSFVAAAAFVGCSSSAPKQPEDSCTWPKTDHPSADGIALAVSHYKGTLFAIDVRSAKIVGRCSGFTGAGITPVFAGNSLIAPRSYSYLVPAVSGASLTVIPANAAVRDKNASGSAQVARGAVRDLHSGKVQPLGFTGWQVAFAVGSRLVLFHVTNEDAGPSTKPTDWCVLPAVTAPQSQCVPVSGSTSSGIPSISSTGAIGWYPTATMPLRVGELTGQAAMSGAALGSFQLADRNQLVSGDQRLVVLVDGPQSRGQFGGPTWATVSTTAGRPSLTLVPTAFTNVDVDNLFSGGTVAGIFATDTPMTITVITQNGSVDRVDAHGTVHTVAHINLPSDDQLGYVMTWPSGSPAT